MGPQETPRAPLRQPLDGHSASRGSPLWTTGTSHHEGVKIRREQGVGIGSDLTENGATKMRRLSVIKLTDLALTVARDITTLEEP